MHYVVVSSVGTFSFLASGTDPELYRFWLEVFKFMWERDWAQVWLCLTVAKKQRKRGWQKPSVKDIHPESSKKSLSGICPSENPPSLPPLPLPLPDPSTILNEDCDDDNTSTTRDTTESV